jgi:hypothetical protein
MCGNVHPRSINITASWVLLQYVYELCEYLRSIRIARFCLVMSRKALE